MHPRMPSLIGLNTDRSSHSENCRSILFLNRLGNAEGHAEERDNDSV